MEHSKMEKNLEKLKQSIVTGEMTGSELVRRLQMMIQQEISKPEKEVDTEFIEACSSLIEHIYPAIAERPEGYYEEQAAKFKVRLQQREKARRRQRILRPAIAVAAVLVIVFLSVGSLRFHWFTAESTPDQQQLIIQGHEVSVDMVAKAIAEHPDVGMLTARDLQQLEEYLGFSIKQLDLDDQGWKVTSVQALYQRNTIIAIIQYINKEDNSLSFRHTINWHTSLQEVYYALEQHESSTIKKLDNKTIYFSTNDKYQLCTWMDNAAINTITTTISGEPLERLILTVLGSG